MTKNLGGAGQTDFVDLNRARKHGTWLPNFEHDCRPKLSPCVAEHPNSKSLKQTTEENKHEIILENRHGSINAVHVSTTCDGWP
jgi:hypothetical protein